MRKLIGHLAAGGGQRCSIYLPTYLPSGSISSEVAKLLLEPVVDLVEGHLSVRRVYDSLGEEGERDGRRVF